MGETGTRRKLVRRRICCLGSSQSNLVASQGFGRSKSGSRLVETIFGPDKLEYLRRQLAIESDKRKVSDQIPRDADTLVLIMSRAFGGPEVRPASTPVLQYHGEYPWGPEA